MLTTKKIKKAHAATLVRPTHHALFFTLSFFVSYLLLCHAALADTTAMGDVLCTVISFVVDGNLGRGLSTLAIIVLGVGALLGKASWGLALTVGVGISVIFGAPDLVNTLINSSLSAGYSMPTACS